MMFSGLQLKIFGAIVGVVLLAGAGYRIFQAGKDSEAAKMKQEAAKEDGKEVHAQTSAVQADLATVESERAAAAERTASAREREAAAEERIVAARSRREQGRVGVDKLTDAQLVGDIASKLQLRPPGDSTPVLYPAELRKVDHIITDYQGLREELDAHVAKDKETAAQIAGVQDQLKAVTRQRDLSLEFGNDMLLHYKRAYDAAQPRCSFLKKIFNWRCGKKFDLPNPVTLKPDVLNNK